MADTQLSTYVYVRDNANDTADARELASTALSEMSVEISTMLTSRVDIVFKTPSQMVSGGATLSDGSAAWGYTFSNDRECWVNTKINGSTLPDEKTRYALVHELGHMVDHDTLNAAKRATIMALMVPAGTTWSAGGYLLRPSECFGDTFPRAFAGNTNPLKGYFDRQIPAASYGAYIAAITGGTGPTATVLAAGSSIGATNIKLSSVTGLSVNDWITVDTGTVLEERQLTFVGTAGSGGTGVSFTAALLYAHANGVVVVEVAGPSDPGGTPGTGPQFSLVMNGVDYIRRIPADSIFIMETGGDAVGYMTFDVESRSTGENMISGWLDNTEFPHPVTFTDLFSNRRLFGGVLTGVTRRHFAGVGVVQQCRAVSYDSWLDRRYVPNYWTTTNTLSSGNKLSDDRLIVQSLVTQANSSGTGLIANDTYVKSTNTAMPKMELGNGSLRQHILAVAEQAATVADPTARRVYVDYFRRVHYFKGDETTTAPYRIGNASYNAVIRATTGLVSHWTMSERSGTTCVDGKAVSAMTLSGFPVRGVSPGVVNEPHYGATYLAGTSYGSATSASYHPGDTFSLELWFRRVGVGTQQTLIDAGAAGDYTLEFQADNTLRLYKKGTGSNFVTNATYTASTWHHLVVSRSPGTTNVYVDGVDKAGTTTARTFAASGSAFYVGQLSDNTLRFNGSVQNVAVYNTALSAATALAHYRAGMTLVPDTIEFDIDYNDSGWSVYVAGKGASGWIYGAGNTAASPYVGNTIIDRDDVNTQAKLEAAGVAFLSRDFAPVQGVTFEVTGYDGWQAGQTVTVADTGIRVSRNYEIKAVEITGNTGYVFTYRISAGAMPYRASFDVSRKNRRGHNA